MVFKLRRSAVGGIGQSIAIDTNRNVYVVGDMYTMQGSNTDNVLIKIDPTATMQWARYYTGIGGNHACSITLAGLSVSPDGGAIYYATACENEGLTSGDFVTLRYNSLGDSVWVKRYPTGLDGVYQYNPRTLKMDRYNNVYLVGFTNTQGVTIKYLSNGVQEWVVATDSSVGKDIFFADTTAGRLNFYVTGAGIFNNVFNAVTIKYSQPVGVIPNSNNLPVKYVLHQNYPNPFNSSTIITYEVPKTSFINLTLFNILGEVVKVLFDGRQG